MRSALHTKSLALVLALFPVLLVAGCGSDETPTTSTPRTTASVTWSTTLANGGASSRSFKTTRNGTVSVTLQSLGGTTASLRVGLGLGIPLGDGSGCVLSRSVEATASATAQLELAVDAGSYCVQVYDPGTLTQPVGFTILLVYPITETT